MNVSLWAEIRRLHEIERLAGRAIARRLHCCTKTVAKALALSSPPTSEAAPKESLLDRYRSRIDALVAKYPDLSAVRVTEEISKGVEGYRGSVYPVRRYLRQVRPARGRVYQEVLYEPGEAMQVDWGDCGRVMIGQTPRRVSVFVAVLCYSRLCYIEFSLSQRKAEFYRALVHALDFFQGSPRKIIFDNLKAAVISGSGRNACLHPEFLALCGYFCLEPIACTARDPESKGTVEAKVRYVKHNALAGRGRRTLELGGLPAFRSAMARRGGQRPAACDHQGTPHRPLSERARPAPRLAGRSLRHRRDPLRRRHAPCPRALRRQPLLRAAGAGPQDGNAPRECRRGADSRSGPGGGTTRPLLREGPAAGPSGPQAWRP